VLTLRHSCFGVPAPRQEHWTPGSTQLSDVLRLNINALHLNRSPRIVELWTSLSDPSHQLQIITDT
jgi:hypothetical protein